MDDKVIMEINAKKKRREGLAIIFSVVFIVVVVILYVTYLRKLAFFQDTFVSHLVGFVKDHIAQFDIMGAFFIALFGGLFFIFLPMELYFINSLNHNSGWTLLLVYVIGMLVSYSADYLIGKNLSNLSRKLISPKKFYRIKSYLNRYGKIAIFGASAIPMLPSQQITFILGVFRYNKTRLLALTVAGQLVKYVVLILIF